MRVGGLFTAIRTTLSGMSNQMKRLDAISENIANADKVADESGKVYQRKIVVPKKGSALRHSKFGNTLNLQLRRTQLNHMEGRDIDGNRGLQALDNTKVVSQNGFKLEYNPGHPRADENGYVKMPKINGVEEMVDLMASTRSYEANVTVLNAAKSMAKKALEI